MVGRAAGYASVNVKIRAMKAKLLSLSDYDRVIQVDNLMESVRTIVGLTMPSKLAEELALLLSRVDDLKVVDLDKAMTRSYMTVHTQLMEMCPEDTREFLSLYLKKYEFDNLKTVIKAIHQGFPPERVQQLLLPPISGDSVVFAEFIVLDSIAALRDAISDELAKAAIFMAFEDYQTTNSTLPLELALDQVLYKYWWDVLSLLPKSDRKWAARLFGMRIDLLNLLSILRGLQMDMDPSTLSKFIIPVNYQLKKNLERAVESKTPSEVVRVFSIHSYEKIMNTVREIVEENRPLSEAEHLIDDYFARENTRVFVSYPFHIGTILAFVNLFNIELKNLRTILIGKAEGVPSAKIRESLIFVR